jgi:HD-like signal output (HDOD) protein|tara:strand:- start:84 stop:938 length:855 start_codon:yes stop_codon:yes gene_type:complete
MSKAEEIRRRVRRLEEIPTLPDFFGKILATIESERANFKDLATIVGEDPVLTSKILKLANSAYYGRFKKVSTVQQAVTTVGFDEIKTVSLSIAVFGSFCSRIPLQALRSFWVHALTTATAIRAIGNRGQEMSLDKIYFGGLLHDIGKLVLCLFYGADYLNVADAAARDCDPCEDEKKVFGMHHAEVGEWLAARWHFPNELTELIGAHHHPGSGSLIRPSSVATVALGNSVAHAPTMKETDSATCDPLLSLTFDTLKVSHEELVSVCRDVKSQEARIKETFSLIS